MRTDLGGIYFNAVFIVVLGGVLAATRAPLLVALIVTSTFQMVEQLLPFVRFDGYYLLCDLAGVPDLFSRVSPTLRGVLSARRNGALGDLRPRCSASSPHGSPSSSRSLFSAPSASCSGCPSGSGSPSRRSALAGRSWSTRSSARI